MRIIFAGTPQAAVPTLEALIASEHEVVAVLTRPPARRGRGRTLHPSEVAEVALAHGIDLIEASTLRDEEVRGRIAALHADLGVVVAYGALIPRAVLDMPRHGWVNLHFSDLPRWRGAAPVQWALLSGDARTASCVFRLEEGLDTGPILSRLEVGIGHETAGELLTRMASLGAAQVVKVADALEAGTATATMQDEGTDGEHVTHARRLDVADGFIDFTTTAGEADARIRAVTPNPGAWTLLPDGRRLKLGKAEVAQQADPATGDEQVGEVHTTRRDVHVRCGDGWLRLGEVAPAGKGWMPADAWARGARLEAGTRLGMTGTSTEEH